MISESLEKNISIKATVAKKNAFYHLDVKAWKEFILWPEDHWKPLYRYIAVDFTVASFDSYLYYLDLKIRDKLGY